MASCDCNNMQPTTQTQHNNTHNRATSGHEWRECAFQTGLQRAATRVRSQRERSHGLATMALWLRWLLRWSAQKTRMHDMTTTTATTTWKRAFMSLTLFYTHTRDSGLDAGAEQCYAECVYVVHCTFVYMQRFCAPACVFLHAGLCRKSVWKCTPSAQVYAGTNSANSTTRSQSVKISGTRSSCRRPVESMRCTGRTFFEPSVPRTIQRARELRIEPRCCCCWPATWANMSAHLRSARACAFRMSE